MPAHEIDLAILMRSLDDETFIAEALLYQEVSRLGTNAKSLERSVVNNALQILEKEREGLEKRNLRLAWTERLIDHLVEIGFSTRFSARPLQRAIEQEIVTQLAFYLNRKAQLRETQLTVDFDPEQQQITIT